MRDRNRQLRRAVRRKERAIAGRDDDIEARVEEIAELRKEVVYLKKMLKNNNMTSTIRMVHTQKLRRVVEQYKNGQLPDLLGDEEFEEAGIQVIEPLQEIKRLRVLVANLRRDVERAMNDKRAAEAEYYGDRKETDKMKMETDSDDKARKVTEFPFVFALVSKYPFPWEGRAVNVWI